MKKVTIYILAALLLYGIFREFTLVKTLLIFAGLASCYLIGRIPGPYILAMKYPVIALSLLATATFFFYPSIRKQPVVEPVTMLLSFYGIAFYLVSMWEKDNGLHKEATALSILFLSVCFNLFLLGRPLLLIAMSAAIILFLFIMERGRLSILMGCYALGILVYLLIKKTAITCAGLPMGSMDKYLLLAVTFTMLAFSFMGFLKKPGALKMLAFFGFIYVAVDILFVLGFRMSAGLLYQPVITLIILAPLMGIMLKGGGGRI
ncbi:MAG: hypothetical protein LBQ00_09695 [Syntrophobacterales bacterium]|jgi:hypothetical protein|nr:hypothetical protein [Syntrophobacterales bacterium]